MDSIGQEQSIMKLILTRDGSHSVYNSQLDEHYHSIHGAIQESVHVFINAGLNAFACESEQINILEIGLGTGLNAILTFMEAGKYKKIHYTAVEAYPLDMKLIKDLNYLPMLNGQAFSNVFDSIHASEFEKNVALSADFIFKKIHNTIQNTIFVQKFDLVYYDAFGPRAQPEMWQREIFQKLYNALNPGAILVTYCAKGEVKRFLKSVGFSVETLPGPPRKREMVRARKLS